MSPHRFLSLLQFADGLFPAGAYAHSFGLEWYVQEGIIRDAAGVKEFLETYLESSAGPKDAVAMIHSMDAARRTDLPAVLEIDQTLEAMKPASELREASRQMGRQTLRTAASLIEDRFLEDLFALIESGETSGHHAVVFGAIGGRLGWPRQQAAQAFLHSAAAAIVGAALRLLPLGQIAGQRILWSLGPLIERLADDVQTEPLEEMWSFTPALEIASARHTFLPARLFRS
ncbi:MAG TPA: urease accessory protein UreF [Terriglobia bacterium]|nr:urease accessory protein UreF [Terriglobia bacterium]